MRRAILACSAVAFLLYCASAPRMRVARRSRSILRGLVSAASSNNFAIVAVFSAEPPLQSLSGTCMTTRNSRASLNDERRMSIALILFTALWRSSEPPNLDAIAIATNPPIASVVIWRCAACAHARSNIKPVASTIADLLNASADRNLADIFVSSVLRSEAKCRHLHGFSIRPSAQQHN